MHLLPGGGGLLRRAPRKSPLYHPERVGPGLALGAAGNPARGGEKGNRRGVRAPEDGSEAAPTRILPANGRGRLSKTSRVEPWRSRGRDGAGSRFRLRIPYGSLLATPGPRGRVVG